MAKNIRFYQIADITIQVNSDLPINDKTFDKKFKTFRVEKSGDDIVSIHHHFKLPEINPYELGKRCYSKAPWTIFEQPDGWLYLGTLSGHPKKKYWKIAQFNKDHSKGHIYHSHARAWKRGGFSALTTFPTDQILLARVLADQQGFFLHSAGAILNGHGILFVGHSEAGKSTITQMLLDAKTLNGLNVEILCDDRNIIRKINSDWKVYGSWNHGDIPDVSPNSAPLKAIFFLEQAGTNELITLDNKFKIHNQLLACLIRSLETDDWWEKTLILLEELSASVPCYQMRFDKSGKIIGKINEIVI